MGLSPRVGRRALVLGRWYSLAILSRSPNGFTYGRATVNAVSTLVYSALDVPLT